MGSRTLSFSLILRALFLDADAYDRLRDDDNPFVEGLFLVTLIGAITALLATIGQLVAWATAPSLQDIERIAMEVFQRTSWWPQVSQSPESLAIFNQWWDWGWRIFPRLAGAPDLAGAALNILVWPLTAVVGWLVYGVLAYLFARLLRGTGTLNQTLGTTALAATPLLLRGLGLIPFLVIGGVLSTWQLTCRYMAMRSAHGLPWQRAVLATVLPFLVYLLFWGLVIAAAALLIAALAGR